MKHLVILSVLAVLLLPPVFVFAQQNVGIGTTTPNANAILDINSNNKGLLVPRLSLTNTTAVSPLSAFVAGLVVYNTATAGDVTPGYYGCDGTKWVKLATVVVRAGHCRAMVAPTQVPTFWVQRITRIWYLKETMPGPAC